MSCVVVIPVYKNELTISEEASLRQCLKVLHQYDTVFICPQTLELTCYEKILSDFDRELVVKKFDDKNFTSINSYSKLLLEEDFYKSFSEYDYMFLYQLDGWVFRDELAYWCGQGFDYIGAPWFEGFNKADENSNFIVPSGNGGVSLRKISPFINILNVKYKYYSIKLTSFLEYLKHHYKKEKSILKICFDISSLYRRWRKSHDIGIAFESYNEDYVVVNIFPRIDRTFLIAPVEKSMYFSFEACPQRLYEMTNHKLPFACHAFERYNFSFWKQFIEFENESRL